MVRSPDIFVRSRAGMTSHMGSLSIHLMSTTSVVSAYQVNAVSP